MSLISLTNANITSFVSFGPCRVRRIHGQNNQGTPSYIQLHQKIPDTIATPLATGNVPAFKSLLATANNGFMYTFSEDGLWMDPLVIGVSSTEPAFTAVGANTALDMTIEVDTMVPTTGGETITGDLSTGVDAINPWTDAVGNIGKRLLQVDYTNNDGATRFLLFSSDAGVTNLPRFIYSVANGASLSLNFGVSGMGGHTQDAAYVMHYGARILQSTTATVAGLTVSTASYIKALWR